MQGAQGGDEEPLQAASVARTAAQLAMVQLLAVLAEWQRCLPEAFAEARYDVGRLLPQVLRLLWLRRCLNWHRPTPMMM